MSTIPSEREGVDVAAGCLTALIVFALVVLVVSFAWNVGICAIIVSAPHITYIEAVGVTIALVLLRGLLWS